MNTKSACPQLLSSLFILCNVGCTGGAHVAPPPPPPVPNACAAYGGFTVLLAKATISCTGTIGPESFTVDKARRLQAKFSQCTVGTPAEREANWKQLSTLLVMQTREAQPGLQACLVDRYERWSDLFRRTKLQTCPNWTDPVVIADGDRKTAIQLSKMQPQLQYLQLKPGDSGPKELKRSSEEKYLDLQVPAKSSILYKISYAQPELACDDPAVCAAQCAAFLPGFVVAAAGNQLLADPISWYRDRATLPCSALPTDDPWCPPFVHGMAITITSPDSTVPAGDLYGDPNRGGKGERCVRWLPGTDGNPGTNYITDLNSQCTGSSPSDCLSRCGN